MRVALSIALLLAAAVAHADVTRAVDAYTRALETEARDARLAGFREAERLFEEVIAGGVENADLYTNLGNAALQAEHLGSAILAYRRALRLDPDHPRALQNLAHARELLPGWVPRQASAGLAESLFFWHRSMAPSERALWAAGCFLVACLLVAAGIQLDQSALRNSAIVPGLAWLAFLLSLGIEARGTGLGDAVVIADEAFLRVADSSLAPVALPRPLPAGTELRVLEQRPPWLRVRLANGRDAWLAAAAAARVEPAG